MKTRKQNQASKAQGAPLHHATIEMETTFVNAVEKAARKAIDSMLSKSSLQIISRDPKTAFEVSAGLRGMIAEMATMAINRAVRDAIKTPPVPAPTDTCPGCSGGLRASQHQVSEGWVAECKGCGGLIAKGITGADQASLVTFRWDGSGEDCPPEDLRYFDITDADGRRVHGWMNAKTRNVVQVG